MTWRLILGIVACYLAYSLVKRAFKSSKLGGNPPPRATRPREPEVLVQDPICGTFIPRQEALKVQKDGRDYFFCSEGCLKRFRRGGPG